MLLSHFDNGKKGPAVLLIHGSASASGAWESQYEFLYWKGFRVISVDLRGHGDSQHSGEICSIEDHLNDLLETIKHLKVKNKITIIGHSFGAVLAVRLAEKYPKLVRKLLLVGMPPKVPRIICLYYKWLLGQPAKYIKKKLNWITTMPFLKRYRYAFYADIRILRQIWRESLYWDFLKDIPRIKCPTYFSVGRFDGIAVSEWVKELHKKLPNSKFTEFKWGAHNLMEDHPKEFNTWLANILDTRATA